jgi:hypothetical protein
VVWLDPWEPSRHLRSVRHQFNNLLAPVVVAAEILDDGSETAKLLARSVARLRDVSNRTGEILRMGTPTPRRVLLEELAAVCGLTEPAAAAGSSLVLDPERLLTNVFSEIAALLAEVSDPAMSPVPPVAWEVGPAPSRLGVRDALQVSFALPSGVVVEDPSDLVVPFALPGVDVRLATVCREVALQGGLVGYAPGTRTVVLCLPLV